MSQSYVGPVATCKGHTPELLVKSAVQAGSGIFVNFEFKGEDSDEGQEVNIALPALSVLWIDHGNQAKGSTSAPAFSVVVPDPEKGELALRLVETHKAAGGCAALCHHAG